MKTKNAVLLTPFLVGVPNKGRIGNNERTSLNETSRSLNLKIKTPLSFKTLKHSSKPFNVVCFQ